MVFVTELLDGLPHEETTHEIKRDEALLFNRPDLGRIKSLQHHDLLGAVHFPVVFQPAKFSPPRGIYECDHLRVEWQQMGHFRQPFYHRNADVDEISLQIYGERTLMTEYGTVEFRPGDFSRIPVGVAHDNYGRDEIHLLFYIPAPVEECGALTKLARFAMPPFEGWQSNTVAELMTNCLGGPHCDIAAFQVDETLLLEHAKTVGTEQLLRVLRAEGKQGGTEWMYKAKDVWIGSTNVRSGDPIVYRRHRQAEEIQCQISGKRTLITQRGIIELEPGDFINIPNGVAFTDTTTSESTHITILTFNHAPAKADIVKVAQETTLEVVQKFTRISRIDGLFP
ncbi:hypothetical protein OIDMADRAFT_25904 [Oidiodendron maius Zn]|uniref:Cupin 2 conserved barrel domain-containing protein n=1 Tax=Oidiodendron maius (strain Zn) TaxID=913774 RepID=A0A0C3DTE1_OIDMZ|nr:hypothetical protein OIDMADRAFT_25904 [Oidiodendron maius Zn]